MDRGVTIPVLYLNNTIFIGNVLKKTPHDCGSPAKCDYSRTGNTSPSQAAGAVWGTGTVPSVKVRGQSSQLPKKLKEI
jgi:hypothetical protein